jgi:uncharacterized protein YdeI (YjbR/CyaY-like superfamily)
MKWEDRIFSIEAQTAHVHATGDATGDADEETGMSPLDVSKATPVSSADEFDRWLSDNGTSEPERVVAIYKKASGRQTVTFAELLDSALRHGWVDTQTKSIDVRRYAIRFAPRRPGSNWSPTNRERVRRLRREGRMTPAGEAVLPPDL